MKDLGVEDDSGVLLLSDGNGEFTKAIGCELDLNDKPTGSEVQEVFHAGGGWGCEGAEFGGGRRIYF
ncbi:hypothetical protein QQ045_013319 [Rhodiola kirilowii]